jgi:hypothetical protein
MKRFLVIVTIAIFAGATVAHAQFGSGVVYELQQYLPEPGCAGL